MNEDIYFSIIVPVYNTEKYLGECIESVINQTFEKWELILVDDGSSDASPVICDEYASKYQNIKVIHKKNSGQFDTRKQGIAVADGLFSFGLDSDDYLEKDCLLKIYEASQVSGADLIAWNLRLVGLENRDIISKIEYNTLMNAEKYIEYVTSSGDHSFCTKAIKTELLRKIDYRYVTGRIRQNDDYMLVAMALCEINSAYTVSDVLYNYRKAGDSISTFYDGTKIKELIKANDFIAEYLTNKGKYTEQVKKGDYKDFLRALSGRLLNAFMYDNISAGECEEIHEMKYYQRSAEYENRDNVSKDRYPVLSMFRNRKYVRLRMYSKYKGLKKKCCRKILKSQS